MAKTSYDIKEIIDISLKNVECNLPSEKVMLLDSLNRVLSEDIYCKKELPAFNNSGMDGYAVRLKDAGKWVEIAGESFAGGNIPKITLEDGKGLKIMTGAPTPHGTEGIVPFENVVEKNGNLIKLPEKLKLNDNHKIQGEEARIGELLLKKGTRLRYSHISLLASQGISVVSVYKKLRVGVFSTGDELKEPWESAAAHQIHNSNSSGIYMALKERGYDVSYIGSLRDEESAIKDGIEGALGFDILFTSGGVSAGEADFTIKALESLGLETFFHGINVKPGKPTMMGRVGETIFFGLPGNPISALMNLQLFALPVLEKMQGSLKFYPTFFIAKNSESFSFKGQRANMVLGTINDGYFKATRGYRYGSGMILPLVESNSFAVIEKGIESLNEGAELKVIHLFGEFGEEFSDYINC